MITCTVDDHVFHQSAMMNFVEHIPNIITAKLVPIRTDVSKEKYV